MASDAGIVAASEEAIARAFSASARRASYFSFSSSIA